MHARFLSLVPLLLVASLAAAGGPVSRIDLEARFQSVMTAVDSLMARGEHAPAASAAEALLGEGRLFEHQRWRLHQRAGLALQALGRYEEALDHLEKAVLWAQREAVNHRNLATLLIDMERPGRAMSEYREACELEPGNWVYLVEYAHVLMTYRQSALAERALEEASSICADCPEVHRAWSRYALDRRDYALARPHLERLHALEPEDADVRSRLALAQLRTERPAEAAALLVGDWDGRLSDDDRRIVLEADRVLGVTEHALSLALAGVGETGDSQDPRLWAQAALVCIDAGHDAEALILVDRALALTPDDPAILNNRVLLLRRLGRETEADRDWERLIALDPSRDDTP